MRYKVFVATPLPQRFLDMMSDRCDVVCYRGAGLVSGEELMRSIRDVEGLLAPSTLPLTAEVVDAAPRLRAISNIGVGYDNVDLLRASQRGILVTNTPTVLSEAVAELALGLVLVMARKLPESARLVQEGRWDASGVAVPLGTDLKGKTLAIIGFGRIGRAVAERAGAFKMRLLCYDVRAELAEVPGVKRAASLEEALREADFVTLHVDLNPASRHLIGAGELALMKPTAYLINTARGAVVDQGALYQALKAGRIAGAALDVLEQEPPKQDEPLLRLPNVFIVPHIGTATRETRLAMVELAIGNLLACLAGEPCECIVNQPAQRGDTS